MSLAVVLPGQGSQFEGMADPWTAHPAGAAALNEASEAMGRDVVSGCRDPELLGTTAFVQPALLACEVAAVRVLEAEGVALAGAAGHSLGEFSALVAAGSLTLAEAVGIVIVRGTAMQRAGEERPGTMAALIGVDADSAQALCDEAREADVLVVANQNSSAQMVISGSVAAIERAEMLAKQRRVRAIRLNVAGAFHSPLMEPAVAPIVEALRRVRLRAPRFPIAENVTGTLVADPEELRELLGRQVISPVRWEACVRALEAAGTTMFLEAGPGDVLTKMAKRIVPDAEAVAIGSPGAAVEVRDPIRRSDILGPVTRFATIAGVGSYLPPRLVPNTWFETIVETDDAWIRDRTGIESRHFAEDGEQTSELATNAARRALDSAGITPEQLDLIVCATVTGDTPLPSTAVWVQQRLGITAPAFDLNAACSGFSYGVSTAAAFVSSGMADTVLVVGAEIFSRIVDFTDRGTCILFGDGAGAAVITASETPGFEGSILGADGTAAEILWMPGGGTRTPASAESIQTRDHFIKMPNGGEVFKRAVTEMSAACRQLLEKSGYSVEDVDVLIPHQANARILAKVVERLGIDPARAVVDVAEVGNTSAASIPIALDRAWRGGRIHTGDLVLFTSFGAGLTWGATLVRWTMQEPPS